MNCDFRNIKKHPICQLGLYGGMPSAGMCKQCIRKGQNTEKYAATVEKKVIGLGDIVHSVAQPIAKTIDAIIGTDIQGCGSCKKRREKLNEMFPISIE